MSEAQIIAQLHNCKTNEWPTGGVRHSAERLQRGASRDNLMSNYRVNIAFIAQQRIVLPCLLAN